MSKESKNELEENKHNYKYGDEIYQETNENTDGKVQSIEPINYNGEPKNKKKVTRKAKPFLVGKDERNGIQEEDSKTMIGDETGFSEYLPKTVHYERQTGTFDEKTLVNSEPSHNNTSRGFPFPSAGSNANVEAAKAKISQMQYNHNRVGLDRAINSAAKIIQELRKENRNHHIFFPVPRDSGLDVRLNSKESRIAIMRQKSLSYEEINSSSKKTTEVSDNTQSKPSTESLTAENNFEILRLNYRVDPGSDDVVGSLDSKSIASLLDEKIVQILRHLMSLKDRIDDTSSKVLVTGDLNSGKSAFCNALLRRSVLPEDQEPCTSVFCEIIDCLENDGVEEVHAIPIGMKYKRKDHRTYKVFQISDLDELVYEAKTYALLIIYVKDNRPPSQSLLRNGVIDIRLIDAPGLNVDSYHTTQVYARQEEIDLVVFVVNAANHFTLSGREFISSAAKDKNFMFIVVNKFDEIKNKERCKGKIAEQLQFLSPETYKNSDEFVHFVSSKYDDDKGKPYGKPDDDPNDPNDDDNGSPGNPNFDHLEASLRGFILEKRAISKLLPAKTYLRKLYSDIALLSDQNIKRTKDRKEELQSNLQKVSPKYEKAVQNSVQVNQEMLKIVEDSASKAYENSRQYIHSVVDSVGIEPLGIKFRGYSNISNFAHLTQEAILSRIFDSVSESEDFARRITSDAVDKIRNCGMKYLEPGALPATKFIPDAMYSKRKDQLQRTINMDFSFTDFINPTFNGFCQTCGISLPSDSTNALLGAAFSKLWKTSISGLLIMYGPQLLSAITGVQSIARFLPATITKRILPVAVIITAIGLPVYYICTDAPHAYQRNVMKKIKKELEKEDYENRNSLRIAKEVRKVLNYPQNDVSIALNGVIEAHSTQRAKLVAELKKGESGMKFYKDLEAKVKTQRSLIESYDLTGVD